MSVKWARIDQCQQILYQNIFIANDSESTAPAANVSRTNNFSGVGPRLGLYAVWAVRHRISLFGDFSGALLSGKRCSRSFALTATGGTIPLNGVDETDRHSVNRAAFQFMFGAQWDWCFWNMHELVLRAAYEAQWWPGQWNVPGSITAESIAMTQQADLGFQGFTLGLGLRF